MESEDVRLAVYRAFQRGRHPRVADLAQALGASDGDVASELKWLAEQRHVAIDDQGEVVMAHPFTAVPLGFSVMGRNTLWWGGCAWDSFSLPHLIPEQGPMLVATTCLGCGAPHAWEVNRSEPSPGAQVAHFLVPASNMWDDVVHTCGNQRIFCSEDCVSCWLADSGHQRGYVMDLATLWRLAAGWYAGRLERGVPAAGAERGRGLPAGRRTLRIVLGASGVATARSLQGLGQGWGQVPLAAVEGVEQVTIALTSTRSAGARVGGVGSLQV